MGGLGAVAFQEIPRCCRGAGVEKEEQLEGASIPTVEAAMNDHYSMDRQTLSTIGRMDSLARRLRHRGELDLAGRLDALAGDLDANRLDSLMSPAAEIAESDSHPSGDRVKGSGERLETPHARLCWSHPAH